MDILPSVGCVGIYTTDSPTLRVGDVPESKQDVCMVTPTDVFAFGAASFHGMRLSRFGSVRDPQFPAQHHERASECRLSSKGYVQCTGVQTSTIGEMV